jgi:predicted DsbA family dithiol-disulfide isomerase
MNVSFDVDDRRTVLHWFDFLCPFCYVGQSRTAILRQHGLQVVDLPFLAHPDIPAQGVAVGPRVGTLYERIEREAKAAGLPLNWPLRLPDTHKALAAAEWIRRRQPQISQRFNQELFAAHFVRRQDLGDLTVILQYALALAADAAALQAALLDGTALAEAQEAESLGRHHGVHGTPAWLIERQLISGLASISEFGRLARSISVSS